MGLIWSSVNEYPSDVAATNSENTNPDLELKRFDLRLTTRDSTSTE